jgi:hypothetical protein
MHTVWTKYGEGIEPSIKPFAIKYGGMSYPGRGGASQKGKKSPGKKEKCRAAKEKK